MSLFSLDLCELNTWSSTRADTDLEEGISYVKLQFQGKKNI